MENSEDDWIEKFIRHLEYERRLSPLTCKHYRRDLDALKNFCDEVQLARWGDIDGEHMRACTAMSYRRGLSAKSIQRRLSAARTFFRYMVREKHVKRNTVESVSAPRS